MTEDNEEEEDDDSYPGHGFPEYGDTTMGEEAEPVMREEAEPAMREEAKEEASYEPVDDLGRAIADAKRNYESEKERLKLERMLEDHKKMLYPNCQDGNTKLGTYWNCCSGRQRMLCLALDFRSY